MRKKIFKIILLIAYTMAVKSIITKFLYRKVDEQYIREHKTPIQYRAYYNTLLLWHKVRLKGKNISEYFGESDTIAVYGMGDIGKLICKELTANGKKALYGIDKNNAGIHPETNTRIYLCGEDLPHADCVIVSLAYLADEIVPSLDRYKFNKIVTIDEILDDLVGRI